jgi:Secretion system C-terminal sorting domain
MKKFTIILTVLFAMTIKANAQIPNGGFENWTTVGNYEDPTFWGSTNSYSTGPFYAITKSTDHYPITVGAYSVRIENDIALLPNYSARGFISTGPPPPSPNFPITGHPTSLTGYYKFAPLNGDTMFINIQLFKNGSSVSTGEYTSTASASNWTSFNITLSAYTNADSGNIILAAYYAPGFNYVPQGNSVLYVDNLNFDNLITSVPEQTSEKTTFSLYPNPASDIVTLNIDNRNNADLTLNIYNVIGALVKSETTIKNNRQINIGDLNNGIYMVEINSNEWSGIQKLIIQR